MLSSAPIARQPVLTELADGFESQPLEPGCDHHFLTESAIAPKKTEVVKETSVMSIDPVLHRPVHPA